MEILQTIWTALTTENQNLINILTIPFSIIEAFVTCLLFTTILKIKHTNKQLVLYSISFSVIGTLTSLFVPSPYYTFINLIAYPILVYVIFKTNILKAILAEIIPYIIFVVLSSILLNICVLFSNNFKSSLLKCPST